MALDSLNLYSRLIAIETKVCTSAFNLVYCINRHGEGACVDEIGISGRYHGHRIRRYSASLANAINTAAWSFVLATRVDHS